MPFVLHGGIHFGAQIEYVPSGSCLYLQFTSEDQKSSYTSKVVSDFKNIQPDSSILKINATFTPRPSSGRYSLTATLNMGWCDNNGNANGNANQLHDGDAISYTTHQVDIGFRGNTVLRHNIKMAKMYNKLRGNCISVYSRLVESEL